MCNRRWRALDLESGKRDLSRCKKGSGFFIIAASTCTIWLMLNTEKNSQKAREWVEATVFTTIHE